MTQRGTRTHHKERGRLEGPVRRARALIQEEFDSMLAGYRTVSELAAPLVPIDEQIETVTDRFVHDKLKRMHKWLTEAKELA